MPSAIRMIPTIQLVFIQKEVSRALKRLPALDQMMIRTTTAMTRQDVDEPAERYELTSPSSHRTSRLTKMVQRHNI
jgi:hypothetical protein